MLNSETIKKFILHQDPSIRNSAMEYFSSSFSEDTEILNLVLDKYSSLNDKERLQLLNNTENLKLDIVSLNKILSYFPNASIMLKCIFEELLCNADLSLLKQVDINSLKLSPDARISINNKIMHSAMPTEALVEALSKWCLHAADNYIEGFDYRLGNLIVSELALRDNLNDNSIIEALTKTEPEKFSLYESYLFKLGGKRKMAALIPVLIRCLSLEYLIADAAQSALVRIGTREVVNAIANTYHFGNDNFKKCAIRVLENIKIPQSVNAISRLRQEETNSVLRTILTGALCKHGDLDALGQLLELIETGSELELSNLDEYIYINCLFNDEIISKIPFLKIPMDRE